MTSRVFRPPPLGRLRLAELDDVAPILELVNESMSKNFRVSKPSDLVYLIENCVLCICQLDVTEVIVGFLAARDYPVVPAIHPGAWEDFIWTKYKTIELNARNTLFIHMLCWNPVYARDVVDNMLKSIFMSDPYVHYIAMLKSVLNFPLLVPGQSRAEASFRRVQALERGVPGDQLPALCIVDRAEVSPRLRIRRAVEEDNDDIVPIIERHSARLRQLYGEFYVSELISRHPESERVLLVCEHKEVAVGVMCLNTQINYEALEENFELSPFAGLRHLEKQPYYKRSKDVDSTFNLLASTTMLDQTPASMSSIEPPIQSKEMKTRVTWQFTEEEFNALRAEGKTWDHEHDGAYTQLDILNLLEDDEEELEFDIVNIDTDLLRVPRLLSHDEILKTDTGLMDDITKVLDSRKHRDSFSDSPRSAKNAKNKRLPTGITSTTPCKPIEPTRYTGSPNAFLLELFAMHQDYDERYGFDMLEASYELFPDRDYCVMCLPSNHTCFPLLEHFTLVTPFGSRLRFVNETLYVAHVNAIRGQVRVRPAEAYDTPNISEVLEHAPRKQDLLDLFESSLVSNILTSFVLLSENQPAGFVILGPLEEGTKIRNQFNLHPEPRRFGTDANILTGVMCPIMEAHGRWFLRELLRQTRYTTLFWACRLFARGDANPCRNLMSLAGHMLPVRPRQFVPNIIRNKELEQLFKEMTTPFALWSLERPLTSLPRVYVNDSIVVVGASRTGLAFLEALLTGPTAEYLTFTNITLVSEHGLPTVPECLRVADTSVPRDGRYTDRYMKSLPFYFYLDVMSGVMVKIDRKRKCIYLKGGGLKFYDELVLTCGLQFQHPDYMKESLEIVKEVEAGKPCDRILMDDPTYLPDRVPPPPDLPDNVMFINSLYDANVYLRKLLKMVSDSKETSYALSKTNQIIVYGDCLEVYTCIAALLEMGLAASMITFVEPYPPEDNTLRVNCFNNETVDARVQASLNNLGIRVYRRCHFSGWRLQGSRVETIRFMAPLHAIHLSCFTLFYYGTKAIDIHSFKAINESGLVYDGGLVVGKSFETNDPNVWGAGPCTRYSRRLHAATQIHKYYSSEDVGEALARMFLRKLDPFITETPDLDSAYSDPILHRGSSLTGMKSSRGSAGSSRLSFSTSKSRWQPVNKFNSPIFQAATLPGPLYYLRLRKPGRETPMAVELLLPHQGHTLITDKRGNYFRLQLNALHCVESVTCLSKKPFCTDIFVQLYGKHEAFFNKLLTRFKMNMIDDLFKYFTKPFMSALYHESFAELLIDLHERELTTVHDVVKTKFLEFHDGINVKDIPDTIPLSCLESAYCKDETKTATKKKGEYNPSECGQNERLRHDAETFWKSVGGENIVLYRIARYFVKNSVTNPHYAVPDYDA